MGGGTGGRHAREDATQGERAGATGGEPPPGNRDRSRHPLWLASGAGGASQSQAPPRRLLATENALRRLQEDRVDLRIEPEIVRPAVIDRLLTPDAVHQGLYVEADPLPAPSFGELGPGEIVSFSTRSPIRTMSAPSSARRRPSARRRIITTERHSPTATGVLAKSASGGLEHVPIIHVRNLGDALDELGRDGVLRVGLDSEGPTDARGDAARAARSRSCSARRTRACASAPARSATPSARLDMPGAIKSLNVSNAAALALYVARRSVIGGCR